MPAIADISKHLHEELIRERKSKESEQRVKDVTSGTVGRVPANFGKSFWELLRQGEITKAESSILSN